MKRWHSYAILGVIISVWLALVFVVPPDKIVDTLGVNAYTAVFIAGVLGGTSILFPFPYYLVVITAAAGGANPLLVGLFSGIGVAIGDSTSYLIGYAGRGVLPTSAQRAFDALKKYVSDIRSWKFSAFLFVYGALIPLPNDVIIMPLGALRIAYWRVIGPFFAGNVVFNVTIAFLAAAGVHLFGL